MWDPPTAVCVGVEAFPINTDYRAGVAYQIEAFAGTLTQERALELFYPERRPPADIAMAAIEEYYRCGREPAGDGGALAVRAGAAEIPYAFDVDAVAIFSRFRERYSIDLSNTSMHWWVFSALLEGLYSTPFEDRVRARTCDLSRVGKYERDYWCALKEKYKITLPGSDTPITGDEYWTMYFQHLGGGA